MRTCRSIGEASNLLDTKSSHCYSLTPPFEKFRREIDFIEAVRYLHRRALKPTARNLRPLLHCDFKSHINDTKERMPPGTLRIDSLAGPINSDRGLGRLRRVLDGTLVYERPKQTNPWAGLSGPIDFRSPQTGLSSHEFRKRYPLKKRPWRKIIGAVYRYSIDPPGMRPQRNGRRTPPRFSDRDLFAEDPWTLCLPRGMAARRRGLPTQISSLRIPRRL